MRVPLSGLHSEVFGYIEFIQWIGSPFVLYAD